MRIAVIGGTGMAGRHTVEAVRRMGHEPVVLSRSRGVDVTTGHGLDDALARVDAVIDATNVQAGDADASQSLFATATRNLLAAEQRAQEEILSAGAIPWTIQRATQFHEFAGMVVAWTRQGDAAMVPPILVQPIAASDAGAVLAEIAAGEPRGRVTDVAGPDVHDLVDMARRTLATRGESVRLVPSWRSAVCGVEAAGEILLPGPEARLAPTTFDAWLATQARQT